MANGAEEDSVKRPQLLQAVGGHHLSGLLRRFRKLHIEGVPVHLESKARPALPARALPSGTTFFPMPSPAMTAILKVSCAREFMPFFLFGCQQRRKSAHIRAESKERTKAMISRS